MFKSILTFALVIMVMGFMFGGKALYELDEKNNETRDIYNYTNCVLRWNSSKYEPEYAEKLNESVPQAIMQNDRLENVVLKFADFIGFTTLEVGKWAVEFGYNNPEIDFEMIFTGLMSLIKLIIIALIVMVVLNSLLPVFAVVYLTGYGIYLLVIKLKKMGKKTGGK